MRLSEVHKGPHPAAKKYLQARAARDLPKASPPKGRIFRTPLGMVKVTPAEGGGMLVTHPGGRVEHIKDRTALSRIGKSFVGGGQARKITELSPRARGVLRRNLAGERAIRSGATKPSVGFLGGVQDMPHTRPPSRMQRRIDGVIASRKPGSKRLLSESPVRGQVRPTRVRNVGVEDADKLSRENAATLSRSLKDAQRNGLKFRQPVVVRAGAHVQAGDKASSSVSSVGHLAGATANHGDSKTITFASGKINRRNATHELYHASGKPNRLTQQKFRKRPKRAATNEEAAADAFASRSTKGRLDMSSGYAVAAKPGSDYDKTFEAVRGRRLRVPFRSKLKSLNEQAQAQKVPAFKPIDMRSVMSGGKPGQERAERYNRMYFERKRLKGV